jgi:DNA-binding transcriptional MerR regulator
MEELLTIGEFAKLRNTSIKALHYYESIGLLHPTYINPKTNYRYYAIEQLPTLDLIRFALELNIPLKEVEEYLNYSTMPDFSGLFEKGKKIVQEQREKIDVLSRELDGMLAYINDCDENYSQEGVYVRSIPERYIISEETTASIFDDNYQLELSHFLSGLQQQNYHTIYPYGVIHVHENQISQTYFYSQVSDMDKGRFSVQTLPQGEYLCFQQSRWGEKPLPSEFRERIEKREGSILVDSFMIFSKHKVKKQVYETQILR